MKAPTARHARALLGALGVAGAGLAAWLTLRAYTSPDLQLVLSLGLALCGR